MPAVFEAALPSKETKPLVISDEFDYAENKLALNWQWNHNPDNRLWSVTARPGHLRLTTGHLARTVEYARNTLTQRTEGPACTVSAKLDVAHMKPGDRAGLVALQRHFGTVGIQVDEQGDRYVAMTAAVGDGTEETVERIRCSNDTVTLKIEFNFEDNADTADFYYLTDDDRWQRIGRQLKLRYTLEHFMGCRIGLFNYATKEAGGYVDYDYLCYSKRMNS